MFLVSGIRYKKTRENSRGGNVHKKAFLGPSFSSRYPPRGGPTRPPATIVV
jgi:hypothetical protein